ncbi:hypothetical protein H4219_003348 [Mycoemilia scoparia]|uniref:Ornithine decarboxylase antizyme n=1 Tax=Mycoemilia scoparia TaxID=417184 RepID=A0A9W7ZV39_9FUNG|nr:hypothetical protein H4219_003348 [Mycoemilia scoparia]
MTLFCVSTTECSSDDNIGSSSSSSKSSSSSSITNSGDEMDIIPMNTMSLNSLSSEYSDEDTLNNESPDFEDAASAAADGVGFYPAECYVERTWNNRPSVRARPTDPVKRVMPQRLKGKKRQTNGYGFSGGMKAAWLASMHSANDLASTVFPFGIPSANSGNGSSKIDASVYFRASRCSNEWWHGFIMDNQLFIYIPNFEGNDRAFRDCSLALMELAEEALQCTNLVVCMPKALSSTIELVRAFMYTGFEMVSPSVTRHNPNYILVGYDCMQ